MCLFWIISNQFALKRMFLKYCSDSIIDNDNTTKLYGDKHIISDFTDGSVFKEHQFFKENPGTLRLHFYNDEFKVVNPLGSKKTKHKINYYMLGNIPYKYRSKLNHIYLATLVRHCFVKKNAKYSLRDIAALILRDITHFTTEWYEISVKFRRH